MNIGEKIKRGVITEKKIKEPEGVQHCLNCGAEYEGAFCPHCGQFYNVKRITARNIGETLIGKIFGFQANLPRTLIDLFYRPGYLISDYINGKRQIYSNPFSTILLLTTIFLFLNQYVAKMDIRDVSTEFNKEFMEKEFSEEIVSNEDAKRSMDTGNKMISYIYDYFGLFNMLSCLFCTLPFWIVFRNAGRYKNRPLNIYEAATVMAYFSCINIIVSTIILPFNTKDNISFFAIWEWVVVIALFVLMLIQMFKMRPVAFIFRGLLFMILLATLYVTCIFIYAIISLAIDHTINGIS